MNEIQKTALEIFQCFTAVCEKLNIDYFLVCGSCLGAVKYKGFIPWDDDIDVALLREDYELFIEKAQALLPGNIFVQNYKTNKEFPLLFTKLRDVNTTFVEDYFSELDICHGIYIDVFPLDGYPEDAAEAAAFEKKKMQFERRRLVKCKLKRFCGGALRTDLTYLMYRLFGAYRDTAKTISEYNRFISSYKIKDSRLWCNHGNWQGRLEYADKAQYGNGAYAEFEGLQVRIPENYDAYLTQKYGSWKEELPKEQQKSNHEAAILDAKRPYTAYRKNGAYVKFDFE